MAVIHKVQVNNTWCVEVPHDALILKIDFQDMLPTVWYKTKNPNAAKSTIEIHMIGTGFEFEDVDMIYVNTVFQGPFVGHFFWKPLP